jgi:hypothetical protein
LNLTNFKDFLKDASQKNGNSAVPRARFAEIYAELPKMRAFGSRLVQGNGAGRRGDPHTSPIGFDPQSR